MKYHCDTKNFWCWCRDINDYNAVKVGNKLKLENTKRRQTAQGNCFYIKFNPKIFIHHEHNKKTQSLFIWDRVVACCQATVYLTVSSRIRYVFYSVNFLEKTTSANPDRFRSNLSPWSNTINSGNVQPYKMQQYICCSRTGI